MPKVRWNDQRHLCSAYQDKRVAPYDRISVSNMAPEQRGSVIQIVSQYPLDLPKRARDVRLNQVRSWFHETYFCWVGGHGGDDPFYIRIQSPVISVEFDHHSGVFSTNKEPAEFHIHTAEDTKRGRLQDGTPAADEGSCAEIRVLRLASRLLAVGSRRE